MLKLDDDFLQEVGLSDLPSHERKPMLAHIRETLEFRVGKRLAAQLTDQQLDEFQSLADRRDDKDAVAWLDTNIPSYRRVVAQELKRLKAEIRGVAPLILDEANTRPAA